MKAEKLKQLRAAGWQSGSAKDFLPLSDAEAALVEIKLSLTDAVRQARIKHKLSVRPRTTHQIKPIARGEN